MLMKEDDIDKKIKKMMEQKEEEISAFKKLLEGLEHETSEPQKTKTKRNRKNK